MKKWIIGSERIGDPTVIRLHHRSDDSFSASEAAHVFLESHQELGTPQQSIPLLAGAGFGRLLGPQETSVVQPSDSDFKCCLESARNWLQELDSELPNDFPCEVLFGLDVYTRSSRSANHNSCQLVAYRSPQSQKTDLIASKRFPASDEEDWVYVEPESEGLPVFVQTSLGLTLALVCHEGQVLDPRGTTNTTTPCRMERRHAVTEDIEESGLDFIFNAIHEFPSETTFLRTYRLIRNRNAVSILAAFGSKPQVTIANAIEMGRNVTIPSRGSLEVFIEPKAGPRWA